MFYCLRWRLQCIALCIAVPCWNSAFERPYDATSKLLQPHDAPRNAPSILAAKAQASQEQITSLPRYSKVHISKWRILIYDDFILKVFHVFQSPMVGPSLLPAIVVRHSRRTKAIRVLERKKKERSGRIGTTHGRMRGRTRGRRRGRTLLGVGILGPRALRWMTMTRRGEHGNLYQIQCKLCQFQSQQNLLARGQELQELVFDTTLVWLSHSANFVGFKEVKLCTEDRYSCG